jgi:hypothetical protein
MYGTVARCTVKPENRAKLKGVFERQRKARQIPGYVASYVLHEEAGDTSWMFAVFQDKAMYRRERRRSRDGRGLPRIPGADGVGPEWHDGDIEGYQA